MYKDNHKFYFITKILEFQRFLFAQALYFLYALSNIKFMCCVMCPPPGVYLLSTSVSKGRTFMAWNFFRVSNIFLAFSASSGVVGGKASQKCLMSSHTLM